jgi:hypothetical protein
MEHLAKANLANLQTMINNTMENLRAGTTAHTPALRVAGNPTPFAQANPELSNSLLGDTKLLIDVYSLSLAYARQRMASFDVEEAAILQIVLAAYGQKGALHGNR